MLEFTTYSYTKANLNFMPPRFDESNKGTYGRVLCVCGSVGMAGAAAFAAKAALRAGAGLAEVLTPYENLQIIQTLVPEAVVSAYNAEMPDEDIIDSAVSRADAIVIGCGMGTTKSARKVLSRVLKNERRVPTVIDADALNLLSRSPSLWKYAEGAVITPHPAEMARLIPCDVPSVTDNICGVCREFALEKRVICVLKDHRTAVSDGSERVYVNQSGNSALATGGSGDVLAGILGGILAQFKNSDRTLTELVNLGVYIHGLCGEYAARELSEYSVIASDIINAIPQVLKTCSQHTEKIIK